MWIALLACGREPASVQRYDPREPFDLALSIAVAELPPVDRGVVLVGEDHRSALSPRLVRELVEVHVPDCLLVEWPEQRQHTFDAFEAHEIPLPCQENVGRRRCPPSKSFAESEMFRAARRLAVHLRAIDRFPKELPALLRSYGSEPDVGQLPDTLQAALLGDRNAEMADTIHALWSEGRCRTAVVLVGAAHLGSNPRGGGLSIPQNLAVLGVPVWSVVVDEAQPGAGVPRWAFAVVNPPDTDRNWRLSMASADQAAFWYSRRIVIHRTDRASVELTGSRRDAAISCLSRTTTSGRTHIGPARGWKEWTEAGFAWTIELTDSQHTETYHVTSRRTFRGHRGQTYQNDCFWSDVIEASE